MSEQHIKSISKFLSLVLRHQPEKIGLQLDEHGWADVAALLGKMAGQQVSMALLEQVVDTNDKKRFAFNEDKTKIRANQGHSVAVDLALTATTPPEILYHGTVQQFIGSIQEQGLQKMSRQHVHLSRDEETAVRVGSRRGKPVILTVNAGAMHRAGFVFYLSENKVWLCDHVPAVFINF